MIGVKRVCTKCQRALGPNETWTITKVRGLGNVPGAFEIVAIECELCRKAAH